MRTTLGWTGLRAAALALGLLAWAPGRQSHAATMQASDSAHVFVTYSTTGQVGGASKMEGVTGDKNVISFESAGGSFTSPSFFGLGKFVINASPDEVVSYKDTPFSITYMANTVNNGVPTPNGTPYILTGVLNGTINANGPNSSLVTATFDPVKQETPFRTGDFLNTLTVVGGNTVGLVPQLAGGVTTLQGQLIVSASPIPEPSTVAVFLLAGAGLLARRRLRRRAA